jgi:hypothetical protein
MRVGRVAVVSRGPEIVGAGWHRLVLPGPLGARLEQTGVTMLDQRTATQRSRSVPPWPTTWPVEQHLPTRAQLRAEIRAERPSRRLTSRLLGRKAPRPAGHTDDGRVRRDGTRHGSSLPRLVAGLAECSGAAK